MCAQELIRNAYCTELGLLGLENAQVVEKIHFRDWIVKCLTDLHSHSFDEGS